MRGFHNALLYQDTSRWAESLSAEEVIDLAMSVAASGDLRFLVLACVYKYQIGVIANEGELLDQCVNRVLASKDADALCLLGEGYDAGWFGPAQPDRAFDCFARAELIEPYKGLYMKGHWYLKNGGERGGEYRQNALDCFREASKYGHVVSAFSYCAWRSTNPLARVACLAAESIRVLRSANRQSSFDRWWRYRDFLPTWPRLVSRLDRKFRLSR